MDTFILETWLPQIDARPHDTTGRPPLALWDEERAHPVPLPAHAYDTAAILYRVVRLDFRRLPIHTIARAPVPRIGATNEELSLGPIKLAECSHS